MKFALNFVVWLFLFELCGRGGHTVYFRCATAMTIDRKQIYLYVSWIHVSRCSRWTTYTHSHEIDKNFLLDENIHVSLAVFCFCVGEVSGNTIYGRKYNENYWIFPFFSLEFHQIFLFLFFVVVFQKKKNYSRILTKKSRTHTTHIWLIRSSLCVLFNFRFDLVYSFFIFLSRSITTTTKIK